MDKPSKGKKRAQPTKTGKNRAQPTKTGKNRAQPTNTAGQGSATPAQRTVSARKNANDGLKFVIITADNKIIDRSNRNQRKNNSTGEVAAQPSAQPSGSQVSQELRIVPYHLPPDSVRPPFPGVPSQDPGGLPPSEYRVVAEEDGMLYPHSNIFILPPYLVLVEEGGVQRLRLRKRFSKCALPAVERFLRATGPYKMPFYLSDGMPTLEEKEAAPFRYIECTDGAFVFRTEIGGPWLFNADEVEALRRDPEGYHEDLDIDYPMSPMDISPPAPLPAPDNTLGSEGYETQVSHASSSVNILTIDPALLSSERPKKRRRSSSPEPAKESGVPQQERDANLNNNKEVSVRADSAPCLDFIPNVMPGAKLGRSTGPSMLSESAISGSSTSYLDHDPYASSEDGLRDYTHLLSESAIVGSSTSYLDHNPYASSEDGLRSYTNLLSDSENETSD
ncbi:hypothetical protein BC835DRAFT_1524207 [Cytidiella melzeri]|nr:hypothetical protein BC835DRAFT_1524207 [Cytidiella melzeri]